jgi:hypothetical protein
VIVFEELGRALVPGPLVGSHLAAPLIDGAAGGARPVALAFEAAGYVEHFGEVDDTLVLTDPALHSTEYGQAESVDPLDPLTPLYRIWDPLTGPELEADVERLRLDGIVLTAALLSGIASRTVELAVAYAKDREQFGKPIGTFQAVKHMCADMLVRAEIARAAVDAAGVLLDASDADAARAVHTAKLLAGEYAVQNAKTCVQVYGGMGFTWEVDVHLYLKRAAVLNTQFGSAEEQSELVASTL